MASTEISIALGAADQTARLLYDLILKRKDGAAASGAEVLVRLEGDGSLAPAFDAKEQRRVTDDEGVVDVTWYRRSIFGRNVKAKLSASIEGDYELSMQPGEPEPVVHTSWTPKRPIKF
jgi:hypothetical protein